MGKRISRKQGKTADALVNEWGLNPEQEEFCKLYASSEEFFGNGVKSYLQCFNIDQQKPNWYKTACSAASQLLSNIKVSKRINDLLADSGLNDQFVDKQTLFLVTQHEDKKAKLGGIKEYNRVKKRIDDKPNVTVNVDLAQLFDAANTKTGD